MDLKRTKETITELVRLCNLDTEEVKYILDALDKAFAQNMYLSYRMYWAGVAAGMVEAVRTSSDKLYSLRASDAIRRYAASMMEDPGTQELIEGLNDVPWLYRSVYNKEDK